MAGVAPLPTTPQSTLDEPVSATILRDLKAIGRKVVLVAVPCIPQKDEQQRKNELRDWDLWGPLVLCLVLSGLLGRSSQGTLAFSATFFVVWIGSGTVTLNAQFLGGRMSFFQTLCALGYCIFPMCVAGAVCSFFPTVTWLKVITAMVCWVWACAASVGFVTGAIADSRRLLAVYPIGLFYFLIAWMLVIFID
eukprot:TRINITY_DN45411_c0_g1_i1.p1 TRINITY_DN45411_c0_g1~~TRINITY_DN45411_c0_g1_i1.p1  ORF type:complete len:211 (+),score=51.67 TRINITY_DN45411_c0_g1_i1:57-635(+)